MNASGCGVALKHYGHALDHGPDDAEKAQRISSLTRDLSELLPALVPTQKPLLGSSGSRKLTDLLPVQPKVIVSANIGCTQHLQTGTELPARHWVEVVDDGLGS